MEESWRQASSKRSDCGGMEKLISMLLDALADQGFDKDASLDVIGDLIARYTEGGRKFRVRRT
ncbi:hypothetical protein GCM10011385_41310 [Nitratireductor aestuarii]|uniref:Uncharacterized protein n=1 Tax=Nitratireductor aestuarii TaxID=1735103 RepID=A0A916S4B5_9HYPH|nr:hypothetical protein GCM10011385_41310 [Nitratireductor aestuarii]